MSFYAKTDRQTARDLSTQPKKENPPQHSFLSNNYFLSNLINMEKNLFNFFFSRITLFSLNFYSQKEYFCQKYFLSQI